MTCEKELNIFCKNIYYLRKKNKYSQKKMAKIMNISTGSLRKVENGIVPRCIYAGTIYRICLHFNISADLLIGCELGYKKIRCE